MEPRKGPVERGSTCVANLLGGEPGVGLRGWAGPGVLWAEPWRSREGPLQVGGPRAGRARARVCVCKEKPPAGGAVGPLDVWPPRPPQASPVMGPSICTSAGTTLRPTPLSVRHAPGTCPGTGTVRCSLHRGPFLTQTAPNLCPRHRFPEAHLHPISCSPLSSWVSPPSVQPWLGRPDPGST